jgi:hypothetical protein
MATWEELAQAAPKIASTGRKLLESGLWNAMLVTVHGDGLPRIHPIKVGIIDERLVAFILGSAKLRDLEQDGRYALHALLDPQAPNELQVRGRARELTDATLRAAAAAAWPFEADDTYRLFEFDIESALLGERPTANDWPPIYTRWSSRQKP